MPRHCPEFLLHEELEILRPRYILGLGAPVKKAFKAIDSYRTEYEHTNLLTVGHVYLGRASATVLLIPHPSPPNVSWEPDDRKLRKYLRSLPASA